jgi:5-methylcytosine-specific restriction endonuclease McrA
MKFHLLPHHRNIPEAQLLADLRSVAARFPNQLFTHALYAQHGRFSWVTQKVRFGTWKAALARVGLKPAGRLFITPDAVIADIQRVAKKLNLTRISRTQYTQYGNFCTNIPADRFGSWANAVRAAGFQPQREYRTSTVDLLANIERLWRHLGRQPTSADIRGPLSQYTTGAYAWHFGTYRKALRAFVAATHSKKRPRTPTHFPNVAFRRTSRSINWRLRFLTLQRDNFRCQACGRSPSTTPNTLLEVDHILPYSKGGETTLENLQSLCTQCNAGKSNLIVIGRGSATGDKS